MSSVRATRSSDAIGTLVVEALADARDLDPRSMSPPLATAIDVDALETLCREGSDVEVQFCYSGHEVTIAPDGDVAVDGTQYRSEERR